MNDVQIKTDDIYCEEFRRKYAKDGFTEEEINQIQEDTVQMRILNATVYGESREITSSTFIRSQKALNKKVSDWLKKGT